MPERNKIYVYPKLPAEFDLGFIRVGGSGLANCMFVAARAWIMAQLNGFQLIEPTWRKFSIGPYIRREKDKRDYFGIFKPIGISGLSKIYLLHSRGKISLEKSEKLQNGIIHIEGLGNYFEDLLNYHEMVKKYFDLAIRESALEKTNQFNFSNCIGIHIRLGDYIQEYRTNIKWYEAMIHQIAIHSKKKYRFILFSDGNDDELKDLMQMEQCERVFFGNALADMIALSRCRLIIGSDSTFSGWAAFLGQVPVIFPKRHFPRVLLNPKLEVIHCNNLQLPKHFLDIIDL